MHSFFRPTAQFPHLFIPCSDPCDVMLVSSLKDTIVIGNVNKLDAPAIVIAACIGTITAVVATAVIPASPPIQKSTEIIKVGVWWYIYVMEYY